MILVRDVFRARFGMGEEAVAVLKEGVRLIKRLGGSRRAEPRLLMDFAGPFFTVVLETTHASLAEYERGLSDLTASAEFPAWYGTVVPLMEGGHREILTVLE
jgi:hypothetical protein